MRKIAYTVRRSKRAKRICLSVHYDGQVVVTSPLSTRKSSIERFVEREREWLSRALASFGSVDKRRVRFFSPDDYQKYKEQARCIIEQRVAYYNRSYRFSFNRISVKNQKTCWGSCSEKKNLNFNYKIMFLPPSVRDYVIVHELCHLKEFNHSPRFWALVEQRIPQYERLRMKLCEYERYFR